MHVMTTEWMNKCKGHKQDSKSRRCISIIPISIKLSDPVMLFIWYIIMNLAWASQPGMKSIYTKKELLPFLLFSTYWPLMSSSPPAVVFILYKICEHVTCGCIRLRLNLMAVRVWNVTQVQPNTHAVLLRWRERDGGILNLRALIHGNNTTGAACAAITQLKSVVTALPGGIRICCMEH